MTGNQGRLMPYFMHRMNSFLTSEKKKWIYLRRQRYIRPCDALHVEKKSWNRGQGLKTERLSASRVVRPHELFKSSKNCTRNPPLAKVGTTRNRGDKGGFKANTEVFMILKISPHPSFPKRGK